MPDMQVLDPQSLEILDRFGRVVVRQRRQKPAERFDSFLLFGRAPCGKAALSRNYYTRNLRVDIEIVDRNGRVLADEDSPEFSGVLAPMNETRPTFFDAVRGDEEAA